MKINLFTAYDILHGTFQGLVRGIPQKNGESIERNFAKRKLGLLIGVKPVLELSNPKAQEFANVKKLIVRLEAQLTTLTDLEEQKHLIGVINQLKNYRDEVERAILARLPNKASEVVNAKKWITLLEAQLKQLTDLEERRELIGVIDQLSNYQEELEHYIDSERKRIDHESELYTERKLRLALFTPKYTNQTKLYNLLFKKEFSDQVIELDYNRIFNKLDRKYKYFKNYDSIKKDYEVIYNICLYQAIVIEGGDEKAAAKYAYLLTILFAGEKNIFDSIEKFINSTNIASYTPFKALFSFEIPVYNVETPRFDLTAWKQMIAKLKIPALNAFEHAYELPSDIKSVRELNEYLAPIVIKQYTQDPEFAKLCRHHSSSKDLYDKYLKGLAENKIKFKHKDQLPNITIDLSKIDKAQKNTFLSKLPAGDKRGLILGEITGCCQSIDNDAEKCALDGTSLENNGFYVFTKLNNNIQPKDINWKRFEVDEHSIIGEFYLWKSQDNNYTLDSIENFKNKIDNATLKVTLEQFADQIFEAYPEVSRITVGRGGRTPKGVFIESKAPEMMLEGYMYNDSKVQYEIKASKELTALRNQIRAQFGLSDITLITSVAKAKLVLSASDELRKKLSQDNFKLLNSIYFTCDLSDKTKLNYTDIDKLSYQHAKMILYPEEFNPGFQYIYSSTSTTPRDLLKFDLKTLESRILNWTNISFYQHFQATPDDIMQFSPDELRAFRHISLINLFSEKNLKLSSFISLPKELLTSDAISRILGTECGIELIKAGLVNPKDLAGKDAKVVMAQTLARNYCNETNVEYISHISENKLTDIILHYKNIKDGLYNVQDVVRADTDQYISDYIIKELLKEKISFVDIHNPSLNAKGLMSKSLPVIRRLCQLVDCKLVDLLGLSNEAIELLTSYEFKECCDEYEVPIHKIIQGFKTMDPEKIKALAELTDFADYMTLDEEERHVINNLPVSQFKMAISHLEFLGKMKRPIIEMANWDDSKFKEVARLHTVCDSIKFKKRDLKYVNFDEIISIANFFFSDAMKSKFKSKGLKTGDLYELSELVLSDISSLRKQGVLPKENFDISLLGNTTLANIYEQISEMRTSKFKPLLKKELTHVLAPSTQAVEI